MKGDLLDLETIKAINFNSPEIQAEFDEIERQNEEILESSKVDPRTLIDIVFTI